MTQSRLITQLSIIRHKVRVALWVRGGSCVLAALLLLLFVVCTGDWLFHFDDPGVRLILGLATLVAVGWIAWRYLVNPLLQPLDNVHLANRVEDRFPLFKESFSSSISFLEHQTDARSGSPALQKKVIDQTLQQAQEIDITDVLETKSLRRAGLIALGVCLFVGTIVSWNRVDSATAMERLVFPFSAQPWPRKIELQFVNESLQPIQTIKQQVARNETIELFVINNKGKNGKGNLPDDLTLEYQFGDDPLIREKMHRGTLTDKKGNRQTVGTFLLIARKGPLKFRAVGGDDINQPMQVVEVVAPPTIKKLQVRLFPPVYTQKKPYNLPVNVGHLRALVGTRVEIDITTSHPVLSAELHHKGEPVQKMNSSQAIRSSKNNHRFSASFVLTRPEISSYWFELTDLKNFKNHQPIRYDLQGLLDANPNVYIAQPSADISVTPHAIILLHIVAKDDWGIRQIDFVTVRRDIEQKNRQTDSLFVSSKNIKEKSVSLPWQLATLQLPLGAQLEFYAEVTDTYNINKPHVTRSLVRVLTVVSPHQKEEELIVRELGLVEELRRSFRMQQDSHEHILGLSLQLQQAGKLRIADLDLLKRAELDQRQIASRLVNPTDGIEVRAKQLQQEFVQNKISSTQMQNRLTDLINTLRRLRQISLSKIEKSLTQSRKIVETNSTNQSVSKRKESQAKKETLHELQIAGREQQEVIDTLDELLSEYSFWRSRQQIAEDFNKLIESQEGLISKTKELSKQTFGKETSQLTPQQRADLARLAQQQTRLATEHADFLKRLRKMVTSSKKEDVSFDSLRRILQEIGQQTTENHMRQAAGHLLTNRIGQAKQEQKQVLENLKNSRDALQNREPDKNELLLKKMKQVATQLKNLEQQQAELLKKREQTEQLTNKQQREQQLMQLRKQQQVLQSKATRQTRTLQRLRSRKASAALRRAARRMQQAADVMEQSNATEEQREALDDLAQSRRELAREQQQIEQQLAIEKMEKFFDIITTLVKRQEGIITETKRLQTAHTKRKRWSRGLLKSLKVVTDAQAQLSKEVKTISIELSQAKILSISLSGTARNMNRAVRQLSKKNTGNETQGFEEAAKRRLVQLARAIRSQTKAEQDASNTGGSGKTSQKEPVSNEVISPLTQLKVMKMLQKEILTRTKELNKQIKKEGTLTPEQASELESLTEEQSLLTDRFRQMLRLYEQFEEKQLEEGLKQKKKKGTLK